MTEYTNFNDINHFAFDYFLSQAFIVHFRQILDDVKAGKFMFDGVDEDDKLSFQSGLNFLTDVAMRKVLVKDKEQDSIVTNSDEYHNNSTISIIERVLSSQHPGKIEFPKLSTIELINVVKEESSFPTSVGSSKHIQTKLHALLLQVLKEDPKFQISGEGISKDLLLYAIHHVINFKETFPRSSDMWIDSVLQVFHQFNVEQVPYQDFIQAFRSKFVSALNILASGLQEVSEPNETLLNQLREKGNNLMSFQSYAQAIKVYTEALLLATPVTDADVPQIYTNRAIAFIGLNCVPEAIDDLNAAIFLDSAFTPAWTQLGYCHLYMGNGLLALECYDLALKSAVGELLPNHLRTSGPIVDEYRDLRMKTILPQFVQRLSSAIALTERRAYQQSVPADKIKNIISDVRKLLARLRAVGPEDDRDCFTYTPVHRDSSLRDLSSRFNESRPNILTPDAAQNILARNGMETATITQVEPTHTTFTRNTTGAGDNDGAQSPDSFDPINRDVWPPTFNFNNMIGGFTGGGSRTRGQDSQQPGRQGSDPVGNAGNAGTTGDTNNRPNGTPGQQPPRPNDRPNFANMFPEALRNGILSTFERFTQGDGNGTIFVNGVEVTNNNRQSNNNQSQSEQPAGTQRQETTSREETRNTDRHETQNQESSSDQHVESELRDEELD
ncbi:hypothetical protein I9W82_001538 [Candida metapsilosis]|uniref:Uncharacterized protein n=1 Tax=Candida metapsilosis TaxID=273372 RepID=A0A8H7ZIB8_9ASCO|nr:hypothetical protein I9W82_001538 [Candida metapsilosis]